LARSSSVAWSAIRSASSKDARASSRCRRTSQGDHDHAAVLEPHPRATARHATIPSGAAATRQETPRRSAGG
jgi:hypothetical protein